MKKQLRQIAFDFSVPAEEQVIATVPPVQKELTAPAPPASIYAEPEQKPENIAAEEIILEPEEKNILEEDAPVIVNEIETEAPLSAKKIKESKTTVADRKPGKRGRRSLKDAEASIAIVNIPPDEELYKKQYYSIGDVAAMFGEKQSLIRFWETEFDILQPRKNRKGDRFFRPVDIKNLEMIFDLLRRRKFTIEGAKDYLKKNKKAEGNYAAIQSLEKIKNFLLELKASL